MRIASGRVDAKLAFVAVDSTDLKTRETGLSSFTVYRSRNGGTATAYTTPTVAELSAANMPGVYVLTVDEDTTITSGVDEEEYVVHITQASMAPVTRAVELYRPKGTEGNTVTVASGGAIAANVTQYNGVNATSSGGRPEVNTTHVAGTAQTARDLGAQLDAAVTTRATPAQVNTEMLDVLATDTQTLPGQVAPPNAPTLVQLWGHLYKAWRNKKDNDGSTIQYYADNGTTVDQKQTVTGGTTVAKAEIATGP